MIEKRNFNDKQDVYIDSPVADVKRNGYINGADT